MTSPLVWMHSGPVFVCVALLLIGGLVIMTGCVEEQTPPAQEEPQATMDPIASGKASFDRYCMGCHGADGKGTGELGTDLAMAPADLTQIKARNNGNFPVDAVFQTIDGVDDIEAHGTREMPVWGNIWEEQGGESVPRETVEKRINELVEYIRSIQE